MLGEDIRRQRGQAREDAFANTLGAGGWGVVIDTDGTSVVVLIDGDTHGPIPVLPATEIDVDTAVFVHFDTSGEPAYVAASEAVGVTGPAARVYNSANQTINNAPSPFQVVTFDSEQYDTGGMHSTSSNTGRLTCVQAGLHHFYAAVQFDSNATGRRIAALAVTNGAVSGIPIAAAEVPAASGVYPALNLSADFQMSVGDYMEVRVYQDRGGTLSLLAGAQYTPVFGCHYIQP